MKMTFRGWGAFQARKRMSVISGWLADVGAQSLSIFRAGMRGPHSGRIYQRRGGPHRASARGEYPAIDSGALLGSLRMRSNNVEVVIGTNMFYSKWLRGGTKKMARRKMSDNALREGRKRAGAAGRWVRWGR